MTDEGPTTAEADLLAYAARGSTEAFSQIVQLHESSVRWSLGRYFHDPTTVDDLAQEVFLCAYQHLRARRTVDNLRLWLLGVARNLAREHLRADVRRRAREQGPLAIQLAQWRIDRLESDAMADDEPERTFAALQDCLGGLAPESRRMVEEHYFRRQSLESIAKRSGRTGGSLRTMLFRIRSVLSKCIRAKLDKRASPSNESSEPSPGPSYGS